MRIAPFRATAWTSTSGMWFSEVVMLHSVAELALLGVGNAVFFGTVVTRQVSLDVLNLAKLALKLRRRRNRHRVLLQLFLTQVRFVTVLHGCCIIYYFK